MNCDEFECGYLNKPYCSLRPFSNIHCCPKFSCPPPLKCQNPCHNSPCCEPCNPNCHCCPQFDFCPSKFPCDPCCQPCFSPCDCFSSCNPCKPNPCCFPLNNLLWFFGGFNCGKKKNRWLDKCDKK